MARTEITREDLDGRSGMTRQELLRKGAASVFGVGLGGSLLAACGGGGSGGGSGAAPSQVSVLGPNAAGLKSWKNLEKTTGLKLQWTEVKDDPGVFTEKVVSGGGADTFDLLHFDGGVQKTLAPKGFTQPIDPSRITGYDKIPVAVRNNAQMTYQGKPYVTPSAYNADSFGYYPKDLGPVNSWKVIFDDNRTLGKVALEDTWLTSLPFAAMYLTYNGIAKINDPSNMTPQEAHTTVDFLIARKKAGQFRTLWSSWEESINLLGTREVIAMGCWEPAIRQLQASGKQVVYSTPKEGYNKWMYGFYIPKHAAGDKGILEADYKLINYFYTGYYGAHIAVEQGYASGRPDLAVQYVRDHPDQFSPADRKYVELKFKEVQMKYKTKYFNQNTQPDHLDAIASEWQRFKQA